MVLSIRNVTKTYPGQPAVLRGVSLGLAAGETLALTGESGSGKSTLLHLAGALDQFDSGQITVDGTELYGLADGPRAALRRTRVSVVFQQFNLIPSLDVQQNVALHARLGGRWDPHWGRQITGRLGLDSLLQRYPEQLSGGQQQRVAIARALALRPALLLADEPTGNLDEAASAAVLDLMLELVGESGTALFLVTHSAAIASRLDRQLRLHHGQVA